MIYNMSGCLFTLHVYACFYAYNFVRGLAFVCENDLCMCVCDLSMPMGMLFRFRVRVVYLGLRIVGDIFVCESMCMSICMSY